MKFTICCFLLLVVGALAEERAKRQATYTFPGPRSDRSYRPQSNPAPVYVEDRDDEETYPAPRRQFQAQPVQQPQYAPQQRAPAQPAPAPPQAPPPVYESPRQAAPAPRSNSGSSARRRASATATSGRANKYASAPQQSLSNNHDEEEEEEQGPDPLTLLLQDSQFSCGGKNDGYYADDSVNCQVFHYCVGGAKHSWMCPENTVFHQVHLNCVPDAQDICSQSQKFHFVNDYLYKAVDYEGPNKTARYSQRYYPEGYSVGDTFETTQDHQPRRPAAPQPPPQQQAPRPQARQVAHAAPAPQQTYRAPPAPQPQSRPASRPSRPLESYPVEAPPQSYNRAPPVRAAPQQQPQSYPREAQPQSYPREQPPPTYRVVPPQQAAPHPPPPQQTYRVVPPQQQASSGYSSEENAYQPQAPPQQSRRPASPQQRHQAAAPQQRPQAVAPQQRPQAVAPYAPPRQQYRPSARSAAGYQPYASNQAAAGVQYDEDY